MNDAERVEREYVLRLTDHERRVLVANLIPMRRIAAVDTTITQLRAQPNGRKRA